MNPSRQPDPEFADLVQRVLNEEATEEDITTLNETLSRDEAARQQYMEMHILEDALQDELGEAAGVSGNVVSFPGKQDGDEGKSSIYNKRKIIQMSAAAAAVVALVISISALFFSGKDARQPVFDVVKISGLDLDQIPAIGETLSSGEVITLTGESVEFRSSDGNSFIFQGPGELEIVSQDHLIIKSGGLFADLDGAPIRIQVPGAEITDLGTTFGVYQKESESTRVDVFDGRVKYANADDSSLAVEVGKGESVTNEGSEWSPVKGVADTSLYPMAGITPRGFAIVMEEREVSAVESQIIYGTEWTATVDSIGVSELIDTPVQVKWVAQHTWTNGERDTAEEMVVNSYLCGKRWTDEMMNEAGDMGFRGMSSGIAIQFSNLSEWLDQTDSSAYRVKLLTRYNVGEKKSLPGLKVYGPSLWAEEPLLVWRPDQEEVAQLDQTSKSVWNNSVIKELDRDFTEDSFTLALPSEGSDTSAVNVAGVILVPVK